jgi:hypothetical protein
MKRAALIVTIVLFMVATFEYLMRRNAEGWCLRLGIAEARVGFDLQDGWRRYCILHDHAPTVLPLDQVGVEAWEGK